jgi:membrane-associated phospholipid phosphatase
VVLALLVAAHPGPLPGEVGYVRGLQRLGEPVPTAAEAVWAATGTEPALVVVAGVAAVWLLRRRGARHAVGVAGAVAVAATTMLLVQPAVKDVVDRPRPTSADVEVRAATTSETFPSGHVMSTTTVWGAAMIVAWRRCRRAVAVVVSVPIALTFVSSAVQGVHWPTDAVAGTLCGAAAAWSIAWCIT